MIDPPKNLRGLWKRPPFSVKANDENELEKILMKAIAEAKKAFGKSLGAGRSRIAFRWGDTVVKIPINDQGFWANFHESTTWEENKDCLARCGYHKELSLSLGVPVLVMEYLRITKESYEDLPDWVGFIDCGQVGYTKDGILKAYDWAP